MGTHLDLDDAVAGHPQAQAELAALREALKAATKRVAELESIVYDHGDSPDLFD